MFHLVVTVMVSLSIAGLDAWGRNSSEIPQFSIMGQFAYPLSLWSDHLRSQRVSLNTTTVCCRVPNETKLPPVCPVAVKILGYWVSSTQDLPEW